MYNIQVTDTLAGGGCSNCYPSCRTVEGVLRLLETLHEGCLGW